MSKKKSESRMSKDLRGADIVAQSLARLGANRVFTLSGNHIMSIFDAAIEAKLDLVHVRHEAAAVHMADAWGRLTGECGIAMVTGGPGHGNAVGALITALGAESPMVLLSGHAATWELRPRRLPGSAPGRHGGAGDEGLVDFDLGRDLGRDIGEAIRIATSGRPGPVHLTLPSDLLEERVERNAVVWPDVQHGTAPALAGLGRRCDSCRDRERRAAGRARAAAAIERERPRAARQARSRNEGAGVIIESPRGLADATLGAFTDIIARADLIVLLGKALDFTVKWASDKPFDPNVRVIAIDPEAALIERAAKETEKRFVLGAIADTRGAAETLIARAAAMKPRSDAWLKELAPQSTTGRPRGRASCRKRRVACIPRKVFRVLRPYVERDPDTVLICDGGELPVGTEHASRAPPHDQRRRRIDRCVRSHSRAPLALRSRMLRCSGARRRHHRVSSFRVRETAARRKLPFVAVLGNDALWNAESQIQLREYGRERMHGCDLTPARATTSRSWRSAATANWSSVRRTAGAIERSLA